MLLTHQSKIAVMWFAIVGLAVSAGWLVSRAGPITQFEMALVDMRVAHFSPPTPMDSTIIIVGFDDQTMTQVKRRTPLDRDYLAEVIDPIASANITALGIDVVLDRPTGASEDRHLQRALAALKGKLVIANEPPFGTILPAFSGLGKVADAWLPYDSDANLVRGPIQGDSFSKLLAGIVAPEISGGAFPRPILWPRTQQGAIRFPVIPAHAVRDGTVDPQIFAGKTVLIGSTQNGIDRHATPLSLTARQTDGLPGVVIHAYLLADLLHPETRPKRSMLIDIVTMVLLAIFGVLMGTSESRPWLQFAAFGSLNIILITAAMIVFARNQLLLPVIPALLVLLFAWLGTLLVKQRRSALAAKHMEGALLTYAGPELLARLSANATIGETAAHTHERELSVLYCDMVGFTEIMETENSAFLSQFINEYLGRMTKVISQHNGRIDKIIGDGIIAFFGADSDNAQADAIACALALGCEQEAISADPNWRGCGRSRIALHSGKAMMGSFGGEGRLDFTAYGPVLNATSRLEGACRDIGITVCASDAVLGAQSRAAPWAPIGQLWLRGIRSPVMCSTAIIDDALRVRWIAAYALLERDPTAAARMMAGLSAQLPVASYYLKRLALGQNGHAIDLRQ
jgi:adenylate cyclase